jgi:proteic killer suppression protein
MDVEHDDPDLERLEKDPECISRHAASVVRQFRRVMLLIREVLHESELYKYSSRHFEKLKGDRRHQYSLRLDRQWRLIVEIKEGADRNCLRIIEIVDYHH